MKKTNFIVVFWLLLALISFVVFIINFSSFWSDIAYCLVPSKDEYMNQNEILRDLIKVVPMILLSILTFVIGVKQGLRNYQKS